MGVLGSQPARICLSSCMSLLCQLQTMLQPVNLKLLLVQSSVSFQLQLLPEGVLADGMGVL